VNAPLDGQETAVVGDDIHNLSDLLFHLCGVRPIKVRQRTRDPESPMIRLGFRDVWSFCYLEQLHLDSSFFRLEDPFRGRKSQDAMRFFTGLHSERLSQLEVDYMKTLDDQAGKREAVVQIRAFMQRFDLGSELDVAAQVEQAQQELTVVETRRAELERSRTASTHPSDPLRQQLRGLGAAIASTLQAIDESKEAAAEQQALRAEFITAKTKGDRTDRAVAILDSVHYQRCPQCATDISGRQTATDSCQLCGSHLMSPEHSSIDTEALRRDLNDRIDQLADAIARREREQARLKRQLTRLEHDKRQLDDQLQRELARYDSAFVESIRAVEREAATLSERLRSLRQLLQLPQAIDDLEQQAGALQGRLDSLRSAIIEERARLQAADANKRHEIQVLRRAGRTWKEIAGLSGVSVRTVRRVAAEAAVTTVDNEAERARRKVGRPSKAEAYREILVAALAEEPTLRSVELLHRARQAGYTGGKSAIYVLAQTLRVRVVTPLVRFEGLPGEFSQHDFGEVLVRYRDRAARALLCLAT